jgi:hypothetical protein
MIFLREEGTISSSYYSINSTFTLISFSINKIISSLC